MEFTLELVLLALAVLLVNGKSVKEWMKDNGVPIEPNEDEELDPRVIGGRNAEEGEFPWMMALHYKGRFICSSFLVTPSVAMTAAHCVVFGDEPEDPQDYTGYAGTIQRDGPEQRVNVTEIIAHEEYGDSTEYDIALLRLSQPVQVGDNCRPICLPTNQSVYENTTAQVIGWGVTEKWGHSPAKILQTATEKVPTYEMCEFTYGILGIPVTRRHICAGGDKDKGVCFGDSGGPLVALNETKPVAIGVASFVSRRGCAQKHIPAVYTRTGSYLDWISQKGDSGSPLVVTNGDKPTAVGIVSFGSFRGCAAQHVPAVCTATSMYNDWILQKMGNNANDLCFVEKTESRK